MENGIYLERDDFARLTIWNRALSTQSVTVSLALLIDGEKRLKNIDGVVNVPALALSTSNTATATLDIPLTDGVLYGFRISTNGTPHRGETFCRLDLRKGTTTGFSRLTLANNYLTGAAPITYGSPLIDSVSGAGVLRYINFGSGAAGFGYTATVPTNTRWRIMYVDAEVSTDATAGNRLVTLSLNALGGGNVTGIATSPLYQAASLGYTYRFGEYANFSSVLPATLVLVSMPEAMCYVYGSGQISVGIAGIAGGDIVSSLTLGVEELIDI